MKLQSYLLTVLVLICLAPSVFADWANPIDTLPYWNSLDHNGLADNKQLSSYTTGFSTSGSNVVNQTFKNVSMGNLEHGILVSDFTGDGTKQFLISNGTKLILYQMQSNVPTNISTLDLGRTIVGQIYVLNDPIGYGLGTYNEIVVLTSTGSQADISAQLGAPSAIEYAGGRVYFVRVNAQKQLFLDYRFSPGDFYLDLTSQMTKTNGLFCKDSNGADRMAICGVYGTDNGSSNGKVVLFDPSYINSTGAPVYKPNILSIKLSASINNFAYGDFQSVYGQNPNNYNRYPFLNKQPITIVYDTTIGVEGEFQPHYSAYWTKSDSSVIYRVDFDERALQGVSMAIPYQYNAAFGGTSGVSVSYSGVASVYPMDTDFTWRHGYIEILGWDYDNDGIQNFCMMRGRDGTSAASGYSYPQIETVCTNTTGGVKYGLYGFGQVESTASPAQRPWFSLAWSRPTMFSAATLNASPSLCYNYGAYIYSPSAGLSNYNYEGIVCEQYNGTGFQSTVSRQITKGSAASVTWNRNGGYRNMIQFQPYTPSDTSYYVMSSGEISKWNGTNFVGNVTLNTSSPYVNGKCAIANFAGGPTLEVGCIDDNIFSIATSNPATFNESNYTAPYYNTLVYPYVTGGDNNFACSGSGLTYTATRCTGNNAATCSFYSTQGLSVRLVTDCGTGTLVTGAWSMSAPTVSCTVPSGAGVLTTRFYLQDQSGSGDYSVFTDQTQYYQPTQCGLSPITTVTPYNSQQDNNSQAPVVNQQVAPADTPQAFFDLVLGQGNTAWKLGMAFLFIIVGMVVVGNTDMVKSMHNGQSVVIGATGIILFVLFTFAGLIPAWIFIAMSIFMVAGVVAWRVFFPSSGN